LRQVYRLKAASGSGKLPRRERKLQSAELHFIVFWQWREFMSRERSNERSNTAAAATSVRRTADNTITVFPPETVKSILVPVRDTLRRTPTRHWKQILEKNLIEEGIAPAKARELVELAAS
jgi:hypothetical protein